MNSEHPCLDALIERKLELYKVEDDRLRNVDVQAGTLGAASLTALALFTAHFKKDASGWEFGLLIALPAAATAILALLARITSPRFRDKCREPPRGTRGIKEAARVALDARWPWLAKRHSDGDQKPEQGSDEAHRSGNQVAELFADYSRLGRPGKAYDSALRDAIGVTDAVVECVADSVRKQESLSCDSSALRAYILRSWDYRQESASRRLHAKSFWLHLAFGAFMLQLAIAIAFVGLSVH